MTKSDHTLRFLGAAGTVTGSRFLIESNSSRVLVDCGVFQGYKQLRLRNRDAFPVAPSTIDATFLVHGEPSAADRLRFRIDHEMGWKVRVVEHLEEIDLTNPH